jgi:hypothetical protein
MATKQQVYKLLDKQGAKYEMYEGGAGLVFDAWLPAEFIWDSGYGFGIVTQEKDPDETWSKFWDGIMAVVNAPVIRK